MKPCRRFDGFGSVKRVLVLRVKAGKLSYILSWLYEWPVKKAFPAETSSGKILSQDKRKNVLTIGPHNLPLWREYILMPNRSDLALTVSFTLRTAPQNSLESGSDKLLDCGYFRDGVRLIVNCCIANLDVIVKRGRNWGK